jgi:hypothetical protein
MRARLLPGPLCGGLSPRLVVGAQQRLDPSEQRGVAVTDPWSFGATGNVRSASWRIIVLTEAVS